MKLKEYDAELNYRAWDAWSEAWDEARDNDRRDGRRYDKERYAEAAHTARMGVLSGEECADRTREGGE